ncbi:uncharacterized protein RAG0_16065 [Rhynchosporium agropyri]|uniref:Uncharacterized protein n=1 Tax=Rhynchosporium agropyri TaxID=914238 RepID=A0A1E1LQI7_9HELO|nr:uncharacterized protein RAG0_16065 [Rhynchosporium agropyri]
MEYSQGNISPPSGRNKNIGFSPSACISHFYKRTQERLVGIENRDLGSQDACSGYSPNESSEISPAGNLADSERHNRSDSPREAREAKEDNAATLFFSPTLEESEEANLLAMILLRPERV